jgi:CRISPR-associated endoribonuclease Cas6
VRIPLDLEALNDQKVLDASEYHKVQGFVYDTLISNTEFRDIHNLITYKFFCFSNIFPPTIVKCGQIRHLLFSSPDLHLIKSVFSHLRENLAENVINIGDQQYRIKAAELLETRITGESCIIRTSTPLSIRIPEKAYDLYNINEKYRKPKFLYWRSNLSHDIFLTMVLNNMRSKYKNFYKTDSCNIESCVQLIILLKEVVIHLPVADYTAKIPASFWRFHFSNLNNDQRDFLNFALDTGLGERNSAGLGFVNVEEGAKKASLERT